MLSIVDFFGCAKVLVCFGYDEIGRYFLGLSKFVGFFWFTAEHAKVRVLLLGWKFVKLPIKLICFYFNC